MARYSYLRRPAAVGGIIVAGVMALSAVPSGATLVCPSGIKPPSPYCTNTPPTATTLPATKITGTSAQLNGSAGPNVQGGDITQYFFQYGTTTTYGSQTPTGTIGSCPSGITSPSPYCNVPATQLVSASVSNLTPCTDYHFRLVATNPDGSLNGADQAFTTTFANPLTKVKTPKKVKAGKKFKVQFTLKYDATSVKIFIKKKKNSHIVETKDYGGLNAGKYKKTLVAPTKKGDYKIEVFAKLSCGQQSVTNPLKVH
jgi:hypothetical protein